MNKREGGNRETVQDEKQLGGKGMGVRWREPLYLSPLFEKGRLRECIAGLIALPLLTRQWADFPSLK